MEVPHNAFNRAIREPAKPQIGLWSSLSSNYSVEVIAGAGFDWILLDTEHSPNDLECLFSPAAGGGGLRLAPVIARAVERHGDDQARISTSARSRC